MAFCIGAMPAPYGSSYPEGFCECERLPNHVAEEEPRRVPGGYPLNPGHSELARDEQSPKKVVTRRCDADAVLLGVDDACGVTQAFNRATRRFLEDNPLAPDSTRFQIRCSCLGFRDWLVGAAPSAHDAKRIRVFDKVGPCRLEPTDERVARPRFEYAGAKYDKSAERRRPLVLEMAFCAHEEANFVKDEQGKHCQPKIGQHLRHPLPDTHGKQYARQSDDKPEGNPEENELPPFPRTYEHNAVQDAKRTGGEAYG